MCLKKTRCLITPKDRTNGICLIFLTVGTLEVSDNDKCSGDGQSAGMRHRYNKLLVQIYIDTKWKLLFFLIW